MNCNHIKGHLAVLVLRKITTKYIVYSRPVAATDMLEHLVRYLKHAQGSRSIGKRTLMHRRRTLMRNLISMLENKGNLCIWVT